MTATRYLVVTDSAEVEAATQVWGKAYRVISREQALNGHAAEIAGSPIVIWPDPETVDRERSYGRQLRLISEDVNLIRTDLPQYITHGIMLSMGWTWKEAIDYLAQDDRARIEVLDPAEIVEIPEARVKIRKSRNNSESPPPSPLRQADAAMRGSQSHPGFPPDGAAWAGDSEPIPLEAYSEAQGPLSADEAYIPYVSTEESSGGPDWGVPLDFWGTERLPTLTADMMPHAFAQYVLDASARSGVDAPQIALNCYVACAGLLRCGIALNMQPEAREGRTWREKPVLWGAVIGLASSGKGPGMDLALDHFREIASQLRKKNEQQWKDYDEKSKIHEKALQTYYHAAAKDPNTQRPEEPEKPPRERLWTDDATKEVVAKLLTENPRGKITILKDELSAWFGSFDAYSANGKSDKDRPDWLSFYESKERYIDRVGPGASYHVESWGGCILGGIQPEVLSRVAAKLGPDGMLQRFMLITNRPKIRPPKSHPDYALIRGWNTLCENLAAMEPRGNHVNLSREASEFMAQCAEWMDKAAQSGLSAPLDAAIGKWEGLFGRLAITSHCIADAAAGLPCPSPEVSLATVQQVWRWMHGLLWPHLVHYYGGSADVTPMDKSVKAFADYVLARDIEDIKPHALASSWTHYRREIRTIQQRREFWDAVCLTGWARGSGALGRSGSIYDRYIINPAVHDLFRHRKAIAKVQVEKYREIAHPAFISAQQREPGEEG
jgi:hypothetical protein